MPRPHKKRCISERPKCNRFIPESENYDEIHLSLDEYETIKWIDAQGLSQENCATVMNVSRTTVQRAYASARQKIGLALVNVSSLVIEGGPINFGANIPFSKHQWKDGECNMKIAIGLNNNQVSMHFGSCNDFRIINVEDGKVISTEDIHDEVSTHHDRPQFLKNLGVEVLILGGIGKGAYNRLVPLGIEVLNGSGLTIDEALDQYLNKTLTSPLQSHECSGHHNHKHEHKHEHKHKEGRECSGKHKHQSNGVKDNGKE